MKNVTVTLDDDVARWARIRAAQLNTSVSRLLGDVLREFMAEEQGYEAAMSQYLARQPQPVGRPGEPYPRRDELHARSGVR